ncbi:unnamed protein product [Ranitomeya imitator]|uniref:Uncharacterized protein n=1 Tax=Ranitomeya imitator TaxID=111125 RepID=A0ABN9L4W2_9NEOB|nr:unnamed protein product [Ranitomeya imitator]
MAEANSDKQTSEDVSKMLTDLNMDLERMLEQMETLSGGDLGAEISSPEILVPRSPSPPVPHLRPFSWRHCIEAGTDGDLGFLHLHLRQVRSWTPKEEWRPPDASPQGYCLPPYHHRRTTARHRTTTAHHRATARPQHPKLRARSIVKTTWMVYEMVIKHRDPAVVDQMRRLEESFLLCKEEIEKKWKDMLDETKQTS